ncbi:MULTISPECIES: DUF6781 family protein [unclassified Burkholderia]|uniref:DUF6781 family protein n=1 Tax=unclassified Burkholderia TaxID=2613784 RepID=UPI00158C9863|nr:MULTISPECIES: DUF6781 family protein [unclassified Burkholderia]
MDILKTDHDALIRQFAEASAAQGEALQEAVRDAMLRALQGRELTLKSTIDTLQAVVAAASAGVAQNPSGAIGRVQLLAEAVEGMDAAMVRIIDVHRRTLQHLFEQGADLRTPQIRDAVEQVEGLESAFFAAMDRAAEASAPPMRGPWVDAIRAFRQTGTSSGPSAKTAVEQLMSQTKQAVADGRALGQHATQAILDHYATLASGVLMGMCEAMSSAAYLAPSPDGK